MWNCIRSTTNQKSPKRFRRIAVAIVKRKWIIKNSTGWCSWSRWSEQEFNQYMHVPLYKYRNSISPFHHSSCGMLLVYECKESNFNWLKFKAFRAKTPFYLKSLLLPARCFPSSFILSLSVPQLNGNAERNGFLFRFSVSALFNLLETTFEFILVCICCRSSFNAMFIAWNDSVDGTSTAVTHTQCSVFHRIRFTSFVLSPKLNSSTICTTRTTNTFTTLANCIAIYARTLSTHSMLLTSSEQWSCFLSNEETKCNKGKKTHSARR